MIFNIKMPLGRIFCKNLIPPNNREHDNLHHCKLYKKEGLSSTIYCLVSSIKRDISATSEETFACTHNLQYQNMGRKFAVLLMINIFLGLKSVV